MTFCCVVDYKMGNLLSVANAVRYLGYDVVASGDPGVIESADVIVLPGVGAFGKAMENLRAAGLIPVLNRLVREQRRPFLGICLGMQLLAKSSSEEGKFEGLGWINGRVEKMVPLSPRVRVPHVGWNTIYTGSIGTLLDGLVDDTSFYFDHSYEMHCDPSIVAASCDYGGRRVVSAIQTDNIFATQFHPEKSQVAGLKLLRRFFRQVESSPVAAAA